MKEFNLPNDKKVKRWIYDEMRYGLHPLLRKMWSLVRRRVIAPVNLRFQWACVLLEVLLKMKALALTLLLVLPVRGEDEAWPLSNDKVIYSATVNQTQFRVFFSTGAFDKANHKITPLRIEGDTGYLPKVDGYTVVGLDGDVPPAEARFPHLTRLAVSFGGKVVEAPAKLISHVFMPHGDATFGLEGQSGRVAISSDGKTVTVELGVGDGCAAGSIAFTFSLDGKCKLGLPEPPTP